MKEEKGEKITKKRTNVQLWGKGSGSEIRYILGFTTDGGTRLAKGEFVF